MLVLRDVAAEVSSRPLNQGAEDIERIIVPVLTLDFPPPRLVYPLTILRFPPHPMLDHLLQMYV